MAIAGCVRVAVLLFVLLPCSAFNVMSSVPQLQKAASSSPKLLSRTGFLSAALGTAVLAGSAAPSYARAEGVNKPELLPTGPEKALVIDLENFLTSGQEKRIIKTLQKLEADTGFKLRVLCQRYPQTPGYAVKDYWDVNDKTVVLVADKGRRGQSNLLNFNVGEGLKFALPNSFWTSLQAQFGSLFYVREQGEDQAVLNAVEAIDYCLRKGFCTKVPNEIFNI